jgi:hypothetical protein
MSTWTGSRNGLAVFFVLLGCSACGSDDDDAGTSSAGSSGSPTSEGGGSATAGAEGASTSAAGDTSTSAGGRRPSPGAAGSENSSAAGNPSAGAAGNPSSSAGGSETHTGGRSATEGGQSTTDTGGSGHEGGLSESTAGSSQGGAGGEPPVCSGPFSEYATVYNAEALLAADFNGDGKPDVVAAGESELAIFTSSSGVLESSTIARPTHRDTMLISADVDGDGKLDLVGTSHDGMRVYTGNGDGTFAAAQEYSKPSSARDLPTALAVGDLRGTGKPDVVVAFYEQLVLFQNQGDGTYGDGTFIDDSVDVGYVTSLFVGDVNDDDKLDVVAIDSEMGGLNVWFGNGDGTFEPRVYTSEIEAFSFPPWFMEDLNGDGDLDLALYYSGLVVWLGNGDGTFGDRADYPLPEKPDSLALGDINHDGNPDLVALNVDTIRVRLGNGDGSFGELTTQTVTGLDPVNATLSDFDGDHNDDLVVITAHPTRLNVLHALGDGTFARCTNPSLDLPDGTPGSVCTSDDDCKTGRCLGMAVLAKKKYCSPQCSTDAQCGEFWQNGGGFNIHLAANLQGSNNRWNTPALVRSVVCDTIGPRTSVGTDDGKKYCWFLCPENSAEVYNSTGDAVTGCACLPNFTSPPGSPGNTYDCQWNSTPECSIFKRCPTSESDPDCPEDVSCVVNADLEGTCFSKTVNIEACVAKTECDGTCLANNCGSAMTIDGADACVDRCCD